MKTLSWCSIIKELYNYSNLMIFFLFYSSSVNNKIFIHQKILQKKEKKQGLIQ